MIKLTQPQRGMNILILSFAYIISLCLSACPTGKTLCNSTCVDTTSDALNCGSCGYICDNGGFCSNSKCVCTVEYDFCGLGGILAQNCSCCSNICSGPGSPMWSNTGHGLFNFFL